MRKLLLVIILVVGHQAWSQEASQYKGHEEIDNQVFSRIFKRTAEHNSLGDFIGEQGGFFFSGGLLDLMGFYPDGVSNGDMTNGDPNAISFLIHYLVFSEISKKISDDCVNSEDPLLVSEYKNEFLKSFKSVCGVEPMDPLSEDQYFQFWTTLHGFSAPMEEYVAWKDFLSRHTFNSHEARIREMTLIAMMNPFYFIKN